MIETSDPSEALPMRPRRGAIASEYIGVISRYAAAWQELRIDDMVDLYAENIVVHYGGLSAFAGVHRGKDDFVAVLVATAQRSPRELLSVDHMDDHADAGTLFVTERFTRADGGTLDAKRAFRFRVEAGKITECWLYEHDQYGVDQAWA